ncbi:MAG: PsbP-related protein [Minisyncoccia bacterium]
MENQFTPPQNLAPQPTPVQSPPPINQHDFKAKYLIIFFVLLMVVGGGLYLYFQKVQIAQKNVATRESLAQQNELDSTISKLEIPDDFLTYNNSIVGFSISYPEVWKTKEIKGVDTLFGGVQIISPGTNIKSNYYQKGDTLEQMFSVSVQLDEETDFKQMKDRYNKYHSDYPSKTDKIISQRDIKINGVDALETTFDSIMNEKPFKVISVYLLATFDKAPNSLQRELGALIQITYVASQDKFDKVLAEKVISTFNDNIWQTVQKKAAERNTPEGQAKAESYANNVQTALKSIGGAIAELIYDNEKSYINICSNGLINDSSDKGLKWAVEMIEKSNNVTTQSAASIKCYSTKDKYAISAKTIDGEMLCIHDKEYKVLSGTADKTSITCK